MNIIDETISLYEDLASKAVFSRGHEGACWFSYYQHKNVWSWFENGRGKFYGYPLPYMTRDRVFKAIEKFGPRLIYLKEWTEKSVAPEVG